MSFRARFTFLAYLISQQNAKADDDKIHFPNLHHRISTRTIFSRSNHFKVASTVMQMSELFGTRVSSACLSLSLIINLLVCRFAFEINCNLLARNQKENNNKTKGKMHNQQATLAHDSFGRVGDVQLTVVGRHAASLACQLMFKI
ncbi:hypothetical protein T4B_15447 [Trichinella pseudospiralis]|uniref:Uncharacterized protein n=1 Tax=Trichinella pseudospiralis TaxID=6337 RepID=A0A0V1IH76_TRIPS|nr:hypothetical protein T4B_15447 [Trichinella pseudospiralis]